MKSAYGSTNVSMTAAMTGLMSLFMGSVIHLSAPGRECCPAAIASHRCIRHAAGKRSATMIVPLEDVIAPENVAGAVLSNRRRFRALVLSIGVFAAIAGSTPSTGAQGPSTIPRTPLQIVLPDGWRVDPKGDGVHIPQLLHGGAKLELKVPWAKRASERRLRVDDWRIAATPCAGCHHSYRSVRRQPRIAPVTAPSGAPTMTPRRPLVSSSGFDGLSVSL